MQDLWPWLALAGMGALHGLNPAALAGMGALQGLDPAAGWMPMPAGATPGRCPALAPRILAAVAAGQLLWSSVASAGHGAGLMLMPALLPLCGAPSKSAGPASDSLFLLAAAVGVHCAAMLLASSIVAALARRAWAFAARRSLSKTPQ